jgi:hypothetical protein
MDEHVARWSIRECGDRVRSAFTTKPLRWADDHAR